jgi:hypothetical protein
LFRTHVKALSKSFSRSSGDLVLGGKYCGRFPCLFGIISSVNLTPFVLIQSNTLSMSSACSSGFLFGFFGSSGSITPPLGRLSLVSHHEPNLSSRSFNRSFGDLSTLFLGGCFVMGGMHWRSSAGTSLFLIQSSVVQSSFYFSCSVFRWLVLLLWKHLINRCKLISWSISVGWPA